MPRDGRQRLALVLTGQAGRDIRWSLDTARADLCYGVGCHLTATGLHAPASETVARHNAALPDQTHFHSEVVHDREGVPLFIAIDATYLELRAMVEGAAIVREDLRPSKILTRAAFLNVLDQYTLEDLLAGRRTLRALFGTSRARPAA